MAVPENFRKLGTIGTAYKGDYDPKEQYKYLNEVYYEGSTYRALKDNPSGPPTADGVNWNYSARGGSGGGGGAVDSVNGKTGVVKLTAEDVKAVAVEGDTADNIVTFISNDTIDEDATSWTVVPKLESGIKHSTLAQRISQMFKNVRYLYKMLGSTDIADIGNGTVTGALSSLNSNLGLKYLDKITSTGGFDMTTALSKYSEFIFVIDIHSNNNMVTITVSAKEIIDRNGAMTTFSTGFYTANNNYNVGAVRITDNIARMTVAGHDGNDYLSTSSMSIYGRV